MIPIPIIGNIIDGITNIVDDLHTSDEERFKLEIENKKLDLRVSEMQVEVNKVEAASTDRFVAGWRPAVGWVCASGLAYNFILYPLLLWVWAAFNVPQEPPPMLDIESLIGLLSGLLGMAGLRTAEKFKKVSRE